MQTTRWCLGGPMHGQGAPSDAYAQFTYTSVAGEKVTYYPIQTQLDGRRREFFAVTPYDLEDADRLIRAWDSAAAD